MHAFWHKNSKTKFRGGRGTTSSPDPTPTGKGDTPSPYSTPLRPCIWPVRRSSRAVRASCIRALCRSISIQIAALERRARADSNTCRNTRYRLTDPTPRLGIGLTVTSTPSQEDCSSVHVQRWSVYRWTGWVDRLPTPKCTNSSTHDGYLHRASAAWEPTVTQSRLRQQRNLLVHSSTYTVSERVRNLLTYLLTYLLLLARMCL